MEIRLLGVADRDRWDAYVAGHPEATFFHRAGWQRVIETGFGHRCPFMYAERDGAIVGVLPLTLIRSRLFGRSLIGNAFSVYGGPLASDDEALQGLLRAAHELGHEERVGAIEYRAPVDGLERAVRREDLYVTFRKPIEPDVDANMKAIPRKQRAMVRKGIGNGLTSRIDADVDDCYAVYAVSVRNLGTPVFGKRYFQALKDEFGDDCEITTVLHQGRAVASVMSFHFRDEVHPYYGGGLAEARDLAANDFMYWEVMRRACERGRRSFDFGRSKLGTGPYAFKKNWKFEPIPLTYTFQMVTAERPPELNPTNPKFQKAIQIWSRLPMPITNTIGPVIARNLG